MRPLLSLPGIVTELLLAWRKRDEAAVARLTPGGIKSCDGLPDVVCAASAQTILCRPRRSSTRWS
jgi:hypothetical protein